MDVRTRPERTSAAVLVAPAWDAARAAAHACGEPLGSERLALRDAHRRTLAQDVRAATDLPPFLSSAMDGWAVCGGGPWVVDRSVLAGSAAGAPLRPGHAVGIATGAPVPDGAIAVVRREDGTLHDGVLTADAVPGRHLRPAGEEAAEGSLLIAAGAVLGPAHLGLAAAAGSDTVAVVRRPTARVLVLGDELLDRGAPGGGRVRDALGPQVPAWLERLGVDCVDVHRVEDTLDAHLAALDAADDVDLVVTTGGTAAGPADHVHRAIAARSGGLVVDSVAVRPGHPMLLATLPGRRWLLGLPGNPQAAVAALLTLGGPLVAALLGRPLPVLGAASSPVDLSAPPHATRLVLAALGPDGAEPTSHHGSGMLRGLAVADGYLVVPPGGSAARAPLRWLPLPA
ncbi:MAG: molybdopterin molybdotransferase MoeA [Actinomycetales bacterium]|nr:molybdopterin molybdotransferase MoeA [Actinomycetales bacterium]